MAGIRPLKVMLPARPGSRLGQSGSAAARPAANGTGAPAGGACVAPVLHHFRTASALW